MGAPCESCAFRSGAAANTEIYNRLRSEICALTGVPFWCHHGKDGTDFTSKTKFVTNAELRSRGMRICEGWKRAVRQHVRPGLTATFKRLVRRWTGEGILQLIDEFIDAEEGSAEKRDAHRRLDRAIRGLHREDGFQ